MRHVTLFLGAIVLISASCPSSLLAQIRYGDFLRATAHSGIVSEGTLVRADSESMTLVASASSDTVHVVRLDLDELERREGKREIGKAAAVVGIKVGAALGIVAGAAARRHDEENGGLLMPNFPYRTVGAALGALAGALVGGLVSLIHVDEWQALPIDAAFIR